VRISAFGRLANLYRSRIQSLFFEKLPELIEHPEYVFQPHFQKKIWSVADEIARESAAANASTWRAAAMKSTNAKKIYSALQEEVAQFGMEPMLRTMAVHNAALISSIPSYVGEQITKRAQRLQLEGKRAGQIQKELRLAMPELAKSRIALIARTEISRAETDFTRVRAERIGLDYYQWETSKDQRVRASHRKLDQVLVSWSDPPAPDALIGLKSTLGPGHAGQFPNCRCIALPIADLDEIKWPARVYRMGSISVMSRSKFAALAGIRKAA
jgi:SPP1 gp7 family putative phage head morphogenesis protein